MINPHWSAAYVGLPWRDHGRDRSACDCWGLVRLVYAEVLTIDLPSYAEAYVSVAEHDEIDRTLRGAQSAPWSEVAEAWAFDVVLIRLGRWTTHVGLMVDAGRMLHMPERAAARIEPIAAAQWARRLVGIWRHAEADRAAVSRGV